MERLEELVGAATDYVLNHGLVGLSLRPLAADLGTSDRMLIYHFGSKDGLVVAILRETMRRSVAEVRHLPPSASPRAAVLDLWNLVSTDIQQRCQRTYVECSTLGLFGREPYATEVVSANAEWLSAITDHLTLSGVSSGVAERAATVMESAFMGFQLDEPVAQPGSMPRAVEDLADAIALLVESWAISQAE